MINSPGDEVSNSGSELVLAPSTNIEFSPFAPDLAQELAQITLVI